MKQIKIVFWPPASRYLLRNFKKWSRIWSLHGTHDNCYHYGMLLGQMVANNLQVQQGHNVSDLEDVQVRKTLALASK
jgi:hypothetical protein